MLPSKTLRLGRTSLNRISTARVQRVRCFACSSKLQNTDEPRSTLSSLWVPAGAPVPGTNETVHEKLVRTGFLRQSQSGIFHMLPLGSRVQKKLERLLDKHMQSLGASRLSMSSLTSEALWRKSGRLDKVSPELFRLKDRKKTPLMLAPTHEEEITALVASTVRSYKELPLRLYQITPKYRDEIRPRNGLLRSREFLMKDLYTFDATYDSAFQTYHEVSDAYKAFFKDIKLPIVVAEASSGEMGGDLSHEYHLAHEIGPDTITTCNSCGYAANDEVATPKPQKKSVTINEENIESDLIVWRGVSKDRKQFVNVLFPKAHRGVSTEEINIHAVKALVPDLDTSITTNPMPVWEAAWEKATEQSEPLPRLVNVIDSSLASSARFLTSHPLVQPGEFGSALQHENITKKDDGSDINLQRLREGDGCPRCDAGTLKVHRALELGHTFYLGTRYSEPLGAKVVHPDSPKNPVAAQMGCFGIGISRTLATVAEHMIDDKGLNWPRTIAPYEVVIVPTSDDTPNTTDVYDKLAGRGDSEHRFDVVLDDRKRSMGWKINDADLTGYPVIVVLGREWKKSQICEIQCRQLSVKENVHIDEVPAFIKGLLERL